MIPNLPNFINALQGEHGVSKQVFGPLADLLYDDLCPDHEDVYDEIIEMVDIVDGRYKLSQDSVNKLWAINEKIEV